MKTEEFAKFVANQQEPVATTKTDWIAIRDEWLIALDALYQNVLNFLQEYTANHSITYSFTDVELDEENIGRYLARRMEINIGRQHIRLVPVGTLIIGCKGRVDAEGPAGKAQILLVNERAKSAADLIRVTVSISKGGEPPALQPPPIQPIIWTWKIVSNTTQRRFVELDKESFFELLLEIANA